MNATELFHKDGRTAAVWYCDKCRLVKRTEQEAAQCCLPNICVCGKECRNYYTVCDACLALKRERREQERFEKAEKVTQWDGWVFLDGYGYNNGYAETIEEMMDYFDDEGLERPKYVWACHAIPFAKASYGDIEERICENAYEDFEPENLKGREELKAAIQNFNELNKNIVSYTPDYTKAILIS